MFGFKKKSPSVDVEFYEQGKVEPFSRTSLPIERLPDTFEIETTLNIRGEEWMVSNARPATKEEFRKTGRVQVFLYKPVIGQMPPGDILFSLPTISDDIGALEESPSLENVFVVHEDDWRQQELVSREFADRISTEMASVQQIYETQRVDVGFKTVHVRSSIPSPLSGVRLNLTDLMTRLGAAHVYRGVAFNNVAAVVRNGFAFRTTQGSVVWGQRCEGDEVGVACVRLIETPSMEQALAPLDKLQAEFDLLFVDWVRVIVTPKISEAVRADN
jgi:hypothetical protein